MMPVLNSSVRVQRAVAIGISLLALVIAGCGSSSKTTSTSQSGLSKSALVSKGDAICKARTNVVTAAASKMLAGGKLPTPKVFGKFANGTVIPQLQGQIDELAALKPPANLASSYKQWLTMMRTALADIKKNPIIIQSSKPFVTLNNDAHSLGFSKACYVGPTS